MSRQIKKLTLYLMKNIYYYVFRRNNFLIKFSHFQNLKYEHDKNKN